MKGCLEKKPLTLVLQLGMGQQDLHRGLKQQNGQLSPVPQDSRLHWLAWKPCVYSGYKDLVRSWSVTITHAEGKKWDAEGPEVRSRGLLVAADGLSVGKVNHTQRWMGSLGSKEKQGTLHTWRFS